MADTMQHETAQAPTTADDEAVMSADMEADREEFRSVIAEGKGAHTRSHIKGGEILDRRIHRNWDLFARGPEARPGIRAQTVRIFAGDYAVSSGSHDGQKIGRTDERDMYRLVRAHKLFGMLPDDEAALLMGLSWSAVRTLVRWVHYDEAEDEYELAYHVKLGANGPDGKEIVRKVDASTTMLKFVRSLAVIPRSVKAIQSLMDQAEAEAREALEIDLTSRQRKQAQEARAMAARLAMAEEKEQFLTNFARRAVKLGFTPADIMDGLVRKQLLPDAPDFDPAKLAEMTESEATIVGKLLIQGNNLDAIVALVATLAPIVEGGDKPTQPNKRATATLDALGSTSRQVA